MTRICAAAGAPAARTRTPQLPSPDPPPLPRLGLARRHLGGRCDVNAGGPARRGGELQPSDRFAPGGLIGVRFRLGQHFAAPRVRRWSRLFRRDGATPADRPQTVRSAQVVGHRQPGLDRRSDRFTGHHAEGAPGRRPGQLAIAGAGAAQMQAHAARRERRPGQGQVQAVDGDRYRPRDHGQRNPGQAVLARRLRVLVPVRAGADAQLAGQYPHPEAPGLQRLPVLGQDPLGACLREQPQHHERVRHRLPTERDAGQRLATPRRAQRSQQRAQERVGILPDHKDKIHRERWRRQPRLSLAA